VRCPPPFGPTMKIFYRRLYMKRCVSIFQQELQNSTVFDGFFAFPNFRKMGEFAVSIEHSEAKSVPASRGLHLPDPRPGAMSSYTKYTKKRKKRKMSHNTTQLRNYDNGP